VQLFFVNARPRAEEKVLKASFSYTLAKAPESCVTPGNHGEGGKRNRIDTEVKRV